MSQHIREMQAFRCKLRLDSIVLNSKIKANYTCLKCFHKFKATPSNVMKGRKCPECKFKKSRQTQEQAILQALDKGFKLGSIYKNNSTKCNYICLKCSFENVKTPTNVQQGRGCIRCSGKLIVYPNKICSKLANVLRARLRSHLKRKGKGGSAVKDLGCTVEELKTHIESLWKPGMNWDNWSLRGWHIDHIRPLASFNMQNPEEFKMAIHYSNLQPLWSIENLKKGTKI